MSTDPALVDQLCEHAHSWVLAAWAEGWPMDPQRRTLLGTALTCEANLLAPAYRTDGGELARRICHLARALHAGGYGEGAPLAVVLEVVATFEPGSPAALVRLIESAELIALHRA